jgi:hypothetical protein
MQKSKLVALFNEMNTYELNSFLKFVKSPYLNNNNTLEIICEYIITNLKVELLDNLDRKHVWENCLPHEPFDYDKLRKHTAAIVKLIEQYYAFENLKNDDLSQQYLALDISRERSKKLIFDHLLSKYARYDTKDIKLSSKSTAFKYLTENILFDNINDYLKRYSDSNIGKVIDNLMIFFFAEFFKQLSNLQAREWEKSSVDNDVLQFIIKKIETSGIKVEENPSLFIYYRIYVSTIDPENIENYYQLRHLIKTYSFYFDEYEAKGFYTASINYCITKMNLGDLDFLKELFEIYKEFLSSELIYEDGKLHDYNFKNIVTTGLRLKEFDWVEYFIESYSSKVPDEMRANTVAYNLAQLNFYKKNYAEVLRLLQEVEYDDLTYNLGAKSMLLATYYELDELDPLYSLLDSFKVYLNRKQNKIQSNFRILYTNLIKFIKQLIGIRHGDQARIDKFIEDVKAAGSVASINWLIEKANELR